LTVSRQLAVLDQLYQIYDQFIASLPVACKKFCARCCTCNVTLTTLEAQKILLTLSFESQRTLMETLKKQMKNPRFIPKITTNRLAALCLSGEDPPEEEMDPSWGTCPLLTDNACPVYEARPFACRCMVSTRPCADSGIADMDDFTLTVNHVFLQYIEHIDKNGFSGNFSDVLTRLIIQESGDSDGTSAPRQNTLIANAPMKTLLIPPEHREKIMPVLLAIRAIQA
jgi:Fe-S-cluster containining protein